MTSFILVDLFKEVDTLGEVVQIVVFGVLLPAVFVALWILAVRD